MAEVKTWHWCDPDTLTDDETGLWYDPDTITDEKNVALVWPGQNDWG